MTRIATLAVVYSWLIGGTSVLLGADRPSFEVRRIDEVPIIDGRLDEAVWKQAALIPGLTQQDPVEQSPPTEKTEIRVYHDGRQLFIGFRCWDREPDQIRATIMKRDQSTRADDYVFVLLDPYRSEREGFYFRTNAAGGKGDGRVTALTTAPQMDWDTIWDTAAHIDGSGWTVEMAIPFRSLAFDEGETTWGINFGRWIARKQEQNRWAAALRNRRFQTLEDEGWMTGLNGDLERGIGLEVKPYGLTRWGEGESSVQGWEADGGLDIFYQITPSLTATLTINTDFAETEVDERVVNLSRFPLFFPEKRDFFLEGSEFFEFGTTSSSLRPFYSRTIGLSQDREKIPILAGLKVTGREGPWGIGFLGVGLDGQDQGAGDQAYTARLSYDVLSESRLGGIVTYGDPRGNLSNEVYGLDFNYKNSRFIADNILDVDFYGLMSRDESDGDGQAYGATLNFPNRPLALRFDLRHIDENFRPAQGFVRRPGTRRGQFSGQWEWLTPEHPLIREVELEWEGEVTTDLDDRIESEDWQFPDVAIEFNTGDQIKLGPRWQREVLDEPFEIVDGVTIPVGDYGFGSFRAALDTEPSRPLSFELSYRLGDYYSGDRWVASAEAAWRPSRYVGFDLTADYFDVDLPEGDFEVIIGSFGFQITPSPRLSWSTQLQYDNVSDRIGINSRVRWTVSPGNDLFLVFNRGLEYRDRSFEGVATEATAKLGWTFRF